MSEFSFTIEARSLVSRYGYGKFFFDKNLGIPGGRGVASHDFMTIEVEDEDERKGIQGVFEIGASYEVIIRKKEAPR